MGSTISRTSSRQMPGTNSRLDQASAGLGNGAMSKVFGGMKLTGIFIAQSGRPISILSTRGTLNRLGRSGINTVNSNLTIEQLQEITGLFFDPVTGRPLMFSPEVVQAVRNDTSPLRDAEWVLLESWAWDRGQFAVNAR